MTDQWAGDLLDRKQDAEFLYNFLTGEIEKRKAHGRIASYVLNVDADWGGGKSFFLDGLAQDIEQKGHLVARVNAWRDDHAQDPYIAIMAAIDKVFAPYIKEQGTVAKAWKATKSSGGAIALKVGGAVVKGLLKNYVGISTEEVGEMIVGTDLSSEAFEGAIEDGMTAAGEQLNKLFDASLEAMIDGFNRTDAAMTDFRSKLESAVAAVGEEKKAPLFILIDELDRCRPTYAVQLLERVKHLFDVPGVVFVFATNSAQLQHSISGAYGANFDGFRYLKRFFDRTYVFGEPTTDQLISTLCETLPKNKIRSPDGKLAEALAAGFKIYGFDLRAIGHVLEMIEATASAWRHPIPIEIALLFPLCAHFYESGKAEWPDYSHHQMQFWSLKRNMYQRQNGALVDKSIKLGESYSLARNVFKDLGEIVVANNRSNGTPTTDYIYGAFTPEWNGRPVEEGRPSIQTELLGLVANAGRMIDTLNLDERL